MAWDDFGGAETANWDQIYGGGEGPAGGMSFEMPRMQAPGFNWDDPEYGGYQGGQGGFGGIDGTQAAFLTNGQPSPEGGTGVSGVQQDAPYTPGPQVGQPSGSSVAGEDDSLWKRAKGGLDKGLNAMKPESPSGKLLAGGLMMGVPALLSGFASMGKSAPKQKSSGPAPTGQAYQTVAPEPLPGTKASPLLSGGPQKTSISQGLEERMRRGGNTGGFALY